MKQKYNIVLVITLMLIILSVSVSVLNYTVSLKAAHKQLKEHSLPLSLDNIYTEIQKNIVEPYLVSSMMANDTFVQDWIINEESNNKIIKYLETIKNKYGLFSTFLVSNKTGNYYTQNGFIEVIKKDNPINKWYFDFKEQQEQHQINLDFNDHMSNDLIMFINYKIFDTQYHFIGATGVALKISYIDDMLKTFRLKHNFIVTFFNQNGDVILAEKNVNKNKNISQMESISYYKDEIISKESQLIEYEKKGVKHILNTKYISELNLYLTVDVTVDKYIKDVKDIFYFNLIISLIITFIIAAIVFYLIRKNNSKLEYLAEHDTLTGILNRRCLEEKLNNLILLHKRNNLELCITFIDIDDFKKINDSYGHYTGDLVLKEFANILENYFRKTDLIARWGGEEFIIVLVDTPLENAKDKIEKLRHLIEHNQEFKNITSSTVTASIGLTKFNKEDTLETFISRSDEAMYKSKKNGKNKMTILK